MLIALVNIKSIQREREREREREKERERARVRDCLPICRVGVGGYDYD